MSRDRRLQRLEARLAPRHHHPDAIADRCPGCVARVFQFAACPGTDRADEIGFARCDLCTRVFLTTGGTAYVRERMLRRETDAGARADLARFKAWARALPMWAGSSNERAQRARAARG